VRISTGVDKHHGVQASCHQCMGSSVHPVCSFSAIRSFKVSSVLMTQSTCHCCRSETAALAALETQKKRSVRAAQQRGDFEAFQLAGGGDGSAVVGAYGRTRDNVVAAVIYTQC
jgi:hypothetical protein